MYRDENRRDAYILTMVYNFFEISNLVKIRSVAKVVNLDFSLTKGVKIRLRLESNLVQLVFWLSFPFELNSRINKVAVGFFDLCFVHYDSAALERRILPELSMHYHVYRILKVFRFEICQPQMIRKKFGNCTGNLTRTILLFCTTRTTDDSTTEKKTDNKSQKDHPSISYQSLSAAKNQKI